MYAVWYGPEGVRAIAERVRGICVVLEGSAQKAVIFVADERTIDESVTEVELTSVASCYLIAGGQAPIAALDLAQFVKATTLIDTEAVSSAHASFARSSSSDLLQSIPASLRCSSPILTQPVFNAPHSETELPPYIYALQEKDLSLAHAMVSLKSCTMKLNVSAANVGIDLARPIIIDELSRDLCTITGFAACSLQPNSGAAGEYAGLSVIRAYHACGESNTMISA
ncbi:unnamed protein product [Rhizoctonia solani]|uniref:Uncharacterized protein n=1 Tax=Rhizoctonia solani TaxID=456999 RepID=A0A8H3EB24_9AGAM|nr:unnamed protein product [Rhizoctonia solani]